MLHATPQPVPATQPTVEATPVPESAPACTTEQPTLFSAAELQAALPPSAPPASAGDRFAKPAPRINRPERFQGEYRSESLDERLDADHPARLVWTFVEGLDLAELFDRVKAVEGSRRPQRQRLPRPLRPAPFGRHRRRRQCPRDRTAQ